MGTDWTVLEPAPFAAGPALLLLAQAARVEASPAAVSATAIALPLLTLGTIANRPSVCLTSSGATAGTLSARLSPFVR